MRLVDGEGSLQYSAPLSAPVYQKVEAAAQAHPNSSFILPLVQARQSELRVPVVDAQLHMYYAGNDIIGKMKAKGKRQNPTVEEFLDPNDALSHAHIAQNIRELAECSRLFRMAIWIVFE